MVNIDGRSSSLPQTKQEFIEEIDNLVWAILEKYGEDVFTPPTDDDRDKFNELNPNAHTRIHCGGIRHGLHQLRREARGLSAKDDLEVFHVPLPKPRRGTK